MHNNKDEKIKDVQDQSLVERGFENILWSTRFFVLLAVIFSMIGGISLFIVASVDITKVGINVYNYYFSHPSNYDIHKDIITDLIGAIDLYLIAIVLFLFGFGLYELFISKIDIAKRSAASKILEIHSLDELKDKLAKVIIMVLMVGFFKKATNMELNNPLDLIYLSASILGLSLAFYFMHKGGNSHE